MQKTTLNTLVVRLSSTFALCPPCVCLSILKLRVPHCKRAIIVEYANIPLIPLSITGRYEVILVSTTRDYINGQERLLLYIFADTACVERKYLGRQISNQSQLKSLACLLIGLLNIKLLMLDNL